MKSASLNIARIDLLQPVQCASASSSKVSHVYVLPALLAWLFCSQPVQSHTATDAIDKTPCMAIWPLLIVATL